MKKEIELCDVCYKRKPKYVIALEDHKEYPDIVKKLVLCGFLDFEAYRSAEQFGHLYFCQKCFNELLKPLEPEGGD